MCIVNFHFQDHPRYKLIVAANRDEFYKRPTKPLHFWEDKPYILAGRDLEAGGTWLGMSKNGRFATLTNYRDIKYFNQKDKRTRGDIVTNFLNDSIDPVSYLEQLHESRNEYRVFNVMVGDSDELYYDENEQAEITKINSGSHSLSNELLNSSWPKMERAKILLNEYVTNHDVIDPEVLFTILKNDTLAPDNELPNTGVGLSLERDLSPIFIHTEGYGTRASTVILISHDNEVEYIERTFNDGRFMEEHAFEFSIE